MLRLHENHIAMSGGRDPIKVRTGMNKNSKDSSRSKVKKRK